MNDSNTSNTGTHTESIHPTSDKNIALRKHLIEDDKTPNNHNLELCIYYVSGETDLSEQEVDAAHRNAYPIETDKHGNEIIAHDYPN